MGVDRRREVLGGQRRLDREGAFRDQLARAGADDPDAEHAPGVGVRDQLRQSVTPAERRRTPGGRPLELRDPDRASLAQGLGLREPAPRDLGVGEDDGRYDDGVERRGPTRDRLGGDLALAHRAVGEHRLAGDVADGPDARVGGAAPLVYGDEAVRVGPDTRRLETQLRADGAAADGDEHAVEGDGGPLAEARLELRCLLVERRHLRAEPERHVDRFALALETQEHGTVTYG